MKFYLDTSVFGGFFDPEFEEETKSFFEELTKAEHTVVVSMEVVREIIKAHERVSGLLLSGLGKIEILMLDEQTAALAEQYVKGGVLSSKHEGDAQHIAFATIAKVDVLVSWNFRHMVNFFRIKQYNEINRKFGYQEIDIRSPKEVMNKNNIQQAREPKAPYGENIPFMQTLRQIRDELSELYWKDPAAYIQETNRIGKEFIERHSAK